MIQYLGAREHDYFWPGYKSIMPVNGLYSGYCSLGGNSELISRIKMIELTEILGRQKLNGRQDGCGRKGLGVLLSCGLFGQVFLCLLAH